jgi:hypothetical protein
MLGDPSRSGQIEIDQLKAIEPQRLPLGLEVSQLNQ